MNSIQYFDSDLKSLLYGRGGRYYKFGRHALHASFILLNLKIGDKILLPSFICRDVLGPINELGLIPFFYDVNLDLTPNILPQLNDVKAVIAVNYFGFPQDISLLYKYCQEHSCYLIEDNSHGLFSADNDRNLLGTRADIGIFSLRKTYEISEGALLSVNSPNLLNQIPNQVFFVNSFIVSSFLIHCFGKFQRLTGIPLLRYFRLTSRFFRKMVFKSEVTPEDPNDEYRIISKENPNLSEIRYFLGSNHKSEISRRKSLYERINIDLGRLNVTPVFNGIGQYTVPMGYPLYLDHKNINEVRKIAKKYKCDLVSWPTLPESLSKVTPKFYNKLWVINFRI